MDIKTVAQFDKDSRRFHRFLIEGNEGITGSIYVSKEVAVPDTILVALKTKADMEKGK
jgi:hypothetical protein